MNHKKVYQKRLQSLDKGKAKSLGPASEHSTARSRFRIGGDHVYHPPSRHISW